MRQIITFLFLVMINISHAQNDCQQVSLSEAKQLALNIINKGKDSQQAHIQASYQKTDEFGNVILYEIVTESTTVLLSGSKDTVQYCHQGHGTVAMPISIGVAQRHLL